MKKESPLPETAADQLLTTLYAGGVRYLFANAGTDFASIIEGLAKAGLQGKPGVRPVLCPHENAAVSMAHGYTMVTGEPQAVMVHVNVGTANGIAGLMNAERERIPMLFMAGRTPILEQGATGSRSLNIHWAQEMFDQGGLLREIVKWDYELRDPRQTAMVAVRALAITRSDPKAPVYLSLPREVLAAEAPVSPAPGTPTMAPAAAIARLCASENVFPALRSATSMPDQSASAASSTTTPAPFHSSTVPAERFDEKYRISSTGKARSASSFRMTPPTCPVAPTTATLIAMECNGGADRIQQCACGASATIEMAPAVLDQRASSMLPLLL